VNSKRRNNLVHFERKEQADARPRISEISGIIKTRGAATADHEREKRGAVGTGTGSTLKVE
jgi:hypothetical protein